MESSEDLSDLSVDVAVLGGGPGGYAAAFRVADLGKRVALVDASGSLGGVCLHVGCIPSKTLLHTAKVIAEAAELVGVKFAPPQLDLAALRQAKASVVARLASGLKALARQRKLTLVQGRGRFASAHTLTVEGAEGTRTIRFEQAIIAVGSTPTRLPGLPDDDPRLMDSSAALELPDIPARLLVIGGGVIGLELATIYQALGSRVSIVEMADQLLPGADPDIVQPLAKRLGGRCAAILLNTQVTRLEPLAEGLRASFAGPADPPQQTYDRVLLAVGRSPNGKLIGADAAGVKVDAQGFIAVDEQLRTNVAHIHAVGDVVGEPMLAHKASQQGKVAAEVIAGHAASFEPGAIPAVAYTDPEVAWMGLTEGEAKRTGVAYEKAVFPWAASGRALSLGRTEGLTKLLFEPGSRRLIGAAIVGVGAGELIAEAVLGLELGALAADLCLAVHPHPSLSETLAMAAEIAEGSITDLYVGRK